MNPFHINSSLFGTTSEHLSSGSSSPSSQALTATSTPPNFSLEDLSKLALTQLDQPRDFLVRNICCVGAGYVGGPTAAVIAFKNPEIRVTVVDKDAARIRKWNSQHPPIHEPGLIDLVRVARDGTQPIAIRLSDGSSVELLARLPNLFFSTEVSKCVSKADIVFLSVNTPTKSSGIGAGAATNMVALEGATKDIAIAAKPGAIIVEKSTVPCRTAQIVRDTLSIHRPGAPFEILSNPEFLAEGTAIKDLLTPSRILIGSSPTPSGLAAAAALSAVYSSWVPPSKILTVNLWSSELAKLVANAMLAQRISSINTISAICEQTGADIDDIARAIGMDERLGSKFLKAGCGFGGSCFKKDILSLCYLARTLHLEEVAEYWMSVLTINEFQRERFVRKVVRKLNGTLIGKKITIFGYAFKKDTSDTRESPAVEVVKSLLADNPAEIAIFDPKCNPEDVKDELSRLLYVNSDGKQVLEPEGPIHVYQDAYEASLNSHAVLILTEWDQFRYPAFAASHADSPSHKSSHNEPVYDRNLETLITKYTHSRPDTLSLALDKKPRQRTQNENALLDSETMKDKYLPQPACDEGCRDCERGMAQEFIAAEGVEWARIAYSMQKPKWVFDGRGLVDVAGMEKLGFRVEVIGKAGSGSRLHGFDA